VATFEFVLAGYRVVHVAKVLKPNETGQLIEFRKTIHLAVSMLVQTAGNVICDPNVQRGAMLVRDNVNPIVVVTHRTRNNQRCFASLNMTIPSTVAFTGLVAGQAA
jgi:hypothetical protein